MHKLKGKTISVKKMINHQDCIWYTFQNGELIKDEFISLVKKEGGEVVEEVIESKYTEEELYKLNKKEQVEILKKLAVDKIPKFEKERVKLLIKLGAKK